MELRLAPSERNEAPLAALLVRGGHPASWIEALERLGLSPLTATVFLLPDAGGGIGGCLVVPVPGAFPSDAGPYERCQLLENLLFIPERSTVFPARVPGELGSLLGQRAALFHPDLGFVFLETKADWTALLALPPLEANSARPPAESVFLPSRVRAFRVQALGEEQALQQLEEQFPASRPLPDKPLGLGEKLKLGLYKLLFRPGAGAGAPGGSGKKPGAVGKLLGKVLGGLFGGAARMMERLQQDFEDLERRNQKEVDKLMNLLEKDPLQGLQYAIPLDEGGTSRGPGGGLFQLFPRWGGLSLFGAGNGGGSGGSVNLGDDSYFRLQQQYSRTAEALIAQGAYEKAAFVYLKLLKNHRKAAETLERGGLYAEAASVYLRYCQDKAAAASAYEKGHMYERALSLYEELGQHEKCGQIWTRVGNVRESRHHYNLAAEALVKQGRYLQAAALCRQHLGDAMRSDDLLLSGWRSNREAEACLRTYCDETPGDELLQRRLVVLCGQEVNSGNHDSFLLVLRHLFHDRPGVSAVARELAYTVVLGEVAKTPAIVGQLLHFNPDNRQLLQDTMRYRTGLRNLPSPA